MAVPEPTQVPTGDAYLLRLAREHRALSSYASELAHQVDERERLLVAGLTARNVSYLELDGLLIRRHGRTGIEIR